MALKSILAQNKGMCLETASRRALWRGLLGESQKLLQAAPQRGCLFYVQQ